MSRYGRSGLPALETTETIEVASRARATVKLDVAPTWWKMIHHRRGGGFSYALQALSAAVDRMNVEPLELHATEDELSVVLSLDSELTRADYEDAAREIRDTIMKSVTVDASDQKDAVRPVEEPKVPEAPPLVTRAELEARLRASGFVPSSELDLPEGRKADDQDIWTLPDTASRCVQFDETTKAGESGKARWMTPTGELVLSFDQIVKRLDVFETRGRLADAPNPEGHAGILPGDGTAHGGVFGQTAVQEAAALLDRQEEP